MSRSVDLKRLKLFKNFCKKNSYMWLDEASFLNDLEVSCSRKIIKIFRRVFQILENKFIEKKRKAFSNI